MKDSTTSEKCAQMLEDINVLFCDVVGHPRVERQLARIRSTAIDLQARILHLEQKNDAESDSIHDLCCDCQSLRDELNAVRQANAHLQSLINSASHPNNQQPSMEVE